MFEGILAPGASAMKLRVIVIGGGIGGLALAQGLRQRGVEVAAYERDRTPADRLQGYRVHINTAGSRALHACLPPEVFAAFLATCGQPNTGIGMFTHRLRELVWFGRDRPNPDPDPVDGVKSASRISLRQVLLAGRSGWTTWSGSARPSPITGATSTAESRPASPTAARPPATCWSAPTAATP